ncbi:MAG: hypothetical protein ACKPKO_46515, partial [Candidatus Fonsibacter sp.]
MGPQIIGLGLRRIQDIATPAELAAKLTARPKITELCQAFTQAGLTPPNRLTHHLDTKIARLQQQVTTQVETQEAQHLPTLIQQTNERAAQEWSHMRNG